MSHQIKKNLGVILYRGKAVFRVWAPFAKSVGIIGTFNDWQESYLESENDGYWSIEIPGAEAGHAYHYLIHTADSVLVRNDPRAKQLTVSDGGTSVIADNSFDWEGDDFQAPPKEKQIIYEMHLGTFNRPDSATPATFADAIEKLDYLKELGITTVQLMPVTSMAYSGGWGYAPNYLFAVEPAYGGRHGLMSFVKACHKRGIGVILDVVYNHFSSNTDLWQYDGWHEDNHGGIYFYNDERGDTPWGGRPDYGRAEVRQFILDNVAMWLTEYKLDGLRIDSTVYMRNLDGRSGHHSRDIEGAWDLLSAINKRAHKINPNALIIAEDDANEPGITKRTSDGGCGFDAQWEQSFPHGVRKALDLPPDQPASLDGLVFALERKFNDNVHEKIIFSDSHDTAANGSSRLWDEADTANAKTADQRGLLASVITYTAPGIPMILQGSEFFQVGAFSDWLQLNWKTAEKNKGIIKAHQDLAKLRLNLPGLTGQSTSIFHRDDTNRVLGYHRWENGNGDDDVLVLCNFGSNDFKEYLVRLPIQGAWQVVFNSSWRGYSPKFKQTNILEVIADDKGNADIPLHKYTGLVLTYKK